MYFSLTFLIDAVEKVAEAKGDLQREVSALAPQGTARPKNSKPQMIHSEHTGTAILTRNVGNSSHSHGGAKEQGIVASSLTQLLTNFTSLVIRHFLVCCLVSDKVPEF